MLASEFLHSTKVEQVLVISENDNRMWIAIKIMAPFSEGSDNGKEFLIEDLIVSFSGV